MTDYPLDGDGYAPTVEVELPDLDDMGKLVTNLRRAFQGDSVDAVYRAAHQLCGAAQDMLERAGVEYEIPPDSLKTTLVNKRVRLKGVAGTNSHWADVVGTVLRSGKGHCVLVQWDNPPIHQTVDDWRSAHALEVLEK